MTNQQITATVTTISDTRHLAEIRVNGLAVDGWDNAYPTREAAEAALDDLLAEYMETCESADEPADDMLAIQAHHDELMTAIAAIWRGQLWTEQSEPEDYAQLGAFRQSVYEEIQRRKQALLKMDVTQLETLLASLS